VRLQFEWEDLHGEVLVDCVPNGDPVALGCPPDALDFPVCTASVRFPAKGYRALLGWVQLVRSTDNDSRGERFQMDPLLLFFDAPSPYCWYGIAPTLFDAPFRGRGVSLRWVAHSFLATTPLDEAIRTLTRPVVPLVGFSWGFDVNEGGAITVHPVDQLALGDWNQHLDILRQTYPDWQFREALTAFRM
jgi:hypothetical protein